MATGNVDGLIRVHGEQPTEGPTMATRTANKDSTWSKDDIKGKAEEAKPTAPPASSVAMEPIHRTMAQGQQRHQEDLEAEGKEPKKADDEVMTFVVPTGSLVSVDIPGSPKQVEVVKVHGLKGKHEVIEGGQSGTSRVAFENPAGPNVTVDVKRK